MFSMTIQYLSVQGINREEYQLNIIHTRLKIKALLTENLIKISFNF